MKISLDISPLQSGHAIRGVGFYVRNLQKYLLEYDKSNEYEFIDSSNTYSNSSNSDLLHIPYFDPFFVHLPLIKKNKLVITVHDLTPLIFPDKFPVGVKGSLKWNVNKQLLKRADAIITDSNSSAKDIHRITGIPESKIHTVYLAAGPEFKQLNLPRTVNSELRTKYKLPEQFVLYVGDVTANKNLPRLIDAIKETNFTLVLVGKSIAAKEYDATNPWNADLVEIQRKMNGDKRFIPLGFVDQEDLVGLYTIADVCVLPSIYEGFGLPVLEAMQSGCPVVTTKGGSLPEVAGDAAHYVDAYDTTSIANGISEVLSGNKLRDEMIKKGLKQAQMFTWKKTIEATVKVYESIK